MLTSLILGVTAVLFLSITAQRLDQSNYYDSSLQGFNGLFPGDFDPYEEDIFQSEGDISEEEKVEMERGIPVVRAQKIRCVEHKSDFKLIGDEHVSYPSRYYNISCVPDHIESHSISSHYGSYNWRIECEPPSTSKYKCVQAYKTVQVFQKNENGCWRPAEQLTVEAGCKCKHNERQQYRQEHEEPTHI